MIACPWGQTGSRQMTRAGWLSSGTGRCWRSWTDRRSARWRSGTGCRGSRCTSWKARHAAAGVDGLRRESSRRPRTSPSRLAAEAEALVCELRRGASAVGCPADRVRGGAARCGRRAVAGDGAPGAGHDHLRVGGSRLGGVVALSGDRGQSLLQGLSTGRHRGRGQADHTSSLGRAGQERLLQRASRRRGGICSGPRSATRRVAWIRHVAAVLLAVTAAQPIHAVLVGVSGVAANHAQIVINEIQSNPSSGSTTSATAQCKSVRRSPRCELPARPCSASPAFASSLRRRWGPAGRHTQSFPGPESSRSPLSTGSGCRKKMTPGAR